MDLLQSHISRPAKSNSNSGLDSPQIQAALNHILLTALPQQRREEKGPVQLATLQLSRQALLAEEGKEERRAITLRRYLESHEGRVPDAPPPDSYGNIHVHMPTRRCVAMVKRWSTLPAPSAQGGLRRRTLVDDQCRQLTRNGAYCWTHLAKAEHLRVKVSSIPGAGKGVFATTHISPGEIIGLYTGDMVRGDFSRRDDPNTGGVYYLQLNSRLCIDAARTDTHVSRFINDPRGSGLRPNCRFVHDGRTSTVRVKATRHIQPGQELLLSYGRTYWDAYHNLLQNCGYTTWSPTSTETHITHSSSPHLMAVSNESPNGASSRRLTQHPTSASSRDAALMLDNTASLYVLDTLAEEAFSVLAAIDTAIYCSVSADYSQVMKAVMANLHHRKRRRKSQGAMQLSAVTTRKQSLMVDTVAATPTHSPLTHSCDKGGPSSRAIRSPLCSPPASGAVSTAAIPSATPQVGSRPTPVDSSPIQRPALRVATTQDPQSSQSIGYADKWISQVSMAEFTALIRKAAETDPEYQAMVIAARLRTPTRATSSRNSKGGDAFSSVTSNVPGPVVEGRLMKLVAKCKSHIEQRARRGIHYTPTDDGLLYITTLSNQFTRLVVPEGERVRTLVLASLHDHDGHPGRDKVTANALSRVWWQGMDADIRKYVASCPKCQQVRAPQGKEQGMAMPLQTPEYPWQWVTMDFVGPFPVANNVASDPLPDSVSSTSATSSSSPGASALRQVDRRSSSKSLRGNDMILVFVDRFTKTKHFAACKSTITAQQVVQLFEQHVVRLHGWPEYLTTDRGSVFTSKYWRNYFLRVGVKLRMTTAYHPQSDGQSEREIKTLQKVLTSYVNTRRDDWDLHLPLVEFAINSTPSVATGRSPFKILYGVDANKPIDIALANLLKESQSPEGDHSAAQQAPTCTVLGPTSNSSTHPQQSASSSSNAPHPRVVAPDAPSHHTLLFGPATSSTSRTSSESRESVSLGPGSPDVECHAPPSDTDFVAFRQAALQSMGPAMEDDSNPAVDARLAELRRVVLETRLALSRHQENIAAAIAKTRRAVNYTVGEQVMLSTQHLVLPTDGVSPSSKLRPNYVGPYSIVRVLSPNVVELQIHPQDTFHPVVNVSRLKPYHANPPSFADRPQPVVRPPPAISGEGHEAEWTVESIVGHRYNRRKKRHEFCVKWSGYDESEATWEPIEHLYDNQYFLQYISERPVPTEVQTLVDTLTQSSTGTSADAAQA